MVLLAIYVAFIANNEIEIEDVLAVSVSDQRYKHRYSGKEDIQEYVSLILDSKNDALQKIEENADIFVIEFEMKNGSIKSYEFFPSLRGECLLKDSSGMIRTVKNVSSLLLRVEYNDIYKPRYLPAVLLSTADGDMKLSPAEYAWNFKKTDNQFYPFNEEVGSSEIPTYNVSAEVLKKGAVSFSVQPDEFKLAYTVDGNSYSNFENLSVKDGEKLEITVFALWKKSDDSSFYGEGKWKFEAIYKESPIITLNKTDAILGECLVLYAENIDVGEMISVETDIVTCKSPVVYKGENKNFALIPIDVNTPDGEYPLKVTHRECEFQFNVKVTAVSNGFFIKNINAETYNSVTSPDGIKEYESFISALQGKSAGFSLCESYKFTAPVDGEAETLFASEILYNGLPPQVYFEGECYAVPQKTSVKSAAKGKVVFAGETQKTGNAIVIDHGNGIMTHYYHLSVISVFEDEEIEGGKLIALSGQSGYTDKESLHFAVSVNGVFVNPRLFF